MSHAGIFRVALCHTNTKNMTHECFGVTWHIS